MTEQLVEGHTVFTVLEHVTCEGEYCDDKDDDQRTKAAAVAVLVRERTEYKDICPAPCADLFRGVLWFNDQYLVEPEYDTTNGEQNQADTIRYPCGGSVLAVNKGDPNPAFLLNAGLASVRYLESYRITDPNDHTWVVDKYLTIVGASTGHPNGYILGEEQTPPSSIAANVAYPVWVVNLFGGEVQTPDTGLATDQCEPYVDGDNFAANADGTYDCTTKSSDGRLDESCYGTTGTEEFAYEPTDPTQNGGATYCYDGNAYTGTNAAGTGCTVTAADGTVSRDPNHPLRLYNAVLFFFLGPGDVRIAANTVTHDVNNDDTNGCQVGTEWACPAGDDNKEGNSHPFNPTTNGQLHGAHAHDTGLVDIYASNTRPVEPVLRNYVVDESSNPNAGRTAPFHS